MKEKFKILICEDEILVSKSLKLFLSKNGFRNILVVESGMDLIYSAMNHYPSLIITDITVKGELDGIEAIARIEEIRNIPYIFITGHPEYLSVIKSYNLKPVKIFIKPLSFDELLHTINSLTQLTPEVPSHYFLG